MGEIPQMTAWLHQAQDAAIEELAQQSILINKGSGEEKYNAYFGQKQLAGCPTKVSPLWDRTRIDFINPEIWGRVEMKSIGYKEVDGRKIFPIYGTSGGLSTMSIFYLTLSTNIFITNPAFATSVTNLAVPTGY
jgi:hypothetical protein